MAAVFMDTALYGKPTRDWFPVYRQAFAAMMQDQTTAEYAQPPVSPAPPAENAAYLGTYENPFFGEIAIVEKDSGLAIVQDPQDMTFAMKHYDRDVFTYVTEGESAVGTAGITFVLGADGKATEAVVETSTSTAKAPSRARRRRRRTSSARSGCAGFPAALGRGPHRGAPADGGLSARRVKAATAPGSGRA